MKKTESVKTQEWEYKLIQCSRSSAPPIPMIPTAWAKPWDINIEKEIADLGKSGWELVSVVQRANHFEEITTNAYEGYPLKELRVFKRPKPD